MPAASVHQTITEALRWLKQSVSLTHGRCHTSIGRSVEATLGRLVTQTLGQMSHHLP